MPNWSKSDLIAYENRRSSSRAKSECSVQNEPVAEKGGEASNPIRLHVSIVSYRRKLCDPDNLVGKFFTDCLRYSGIIPNDRDEDIIFQISQVKVKTKSEERTEIEVI